MYVDVNVPAPSRDVGSAFITLVIERRFWVSDTKNDFSFLLHPLFLAGEGEVLD